ncbi:MAG: MBL fold metallo-hydrolase, partial [Bacteroidia bacterium]
KIPGLLCEQFFHRKGKEPKEPIEILAFDKEAFLAPSDKAKMIWYGHSVILMRIHGLTILIDPMLGPNASPIAPFPTKRFSDNTLELIEEFPEIDILLMTHDHYDHVDLDSFRLLKPKVKKYVTTLGTGRHYEAWGVSSDDIIEMDWWESVELNGVKIHCTPSRHFAGRGATNRAKSFWGGWVIKSPDENLYFSGDGGYGEHFKEVGRRLGPFDFGIMECGQYNELWHNIHMYPEESIQAASDALVQKIMPVHWAGFALAMHSWKEPVERFVAEAKEKKVPYIVPRLGEVFSRDFSSIENWWTPLK